MLKDNGGGLSTARVGVTPVLVIPKSKLARSENEARPLLFEVLRRFEVFVQPSGWRGDVGLAAGL
jgi:hypothetical protein